MKKLMMVALATGSMMALASPVAAQSVTGTVNITGTVNDKCLVLPGAGNTFTANVDLMDLAAVDGTLATDLSARFSSVGGNALIVRVVCTTANPAISVNATELTTTGTPPAGYANRIDFRANVAAALTPSGSATVSNDSRGAATPLTALGSRLANNGQGNLTITADMFGTASPTDLLVAGAYTGQISIVVAPGA